MSEFDIDSAWQLAQAAARLGGSLAAGGKASWVKHKSGNRGLVTELDYKSEQAIVDLLRRESPFPVLGEESGLQGSSGEYCWVVDPIDGTTNLARNIPLFSTSVALLAGSSTKGYRSVVGVIYESVRDECFHAAVGRGAFLNEAPISVSSVHDIQAAVVFVNHGYAKEARERAAEVVERLIPYLYLRKLGTTALELAYVAAGRADSFVCSGDELWDFAAGVVLIEEAGGSVTDWHGRSWNGKSDFILASNGILGEKLVDHVSDLQRPTTG